jgi:hypothetical protein
MGGSFSVQSGLRQGTVVTCAVPRQMARHLRAADTGETARKRRGGRRSGSDQPEVAAAFNR